MNIEKAISRLKNYIKKYEERERFCIAINEETLKEAIKTLLTAYEEKEEKCNLLDNEFI